MKLDNRGAHLTYCTNIHPGESWAETRGNVFDHVPRVRSHLGPLQPFGVGLRLSNLAATALESKGELEAFKTALARENLYVFTLNGFPYGTFHRTAVKTSVYRPDWSEVERLTYTRRLIRILEHLVPAGLSGSISTVPGCYADRADPATVGRIRDNLIDAAATLWAVHDRSGVDLCLALEPEPCCFLETIAQSTAFFHDHLWGAEARQRFCRSTGLGPAAAELAIRERLGLCLDACHAAVEFEDPRQILHDIAASGIRLAKVQLTTGLQLDIRDDQARAAIEAFADPVYLHQVVARDHAGCLTRWPDLAPALEAYDRGMTTAHNWRVHFHVPVFMNELGPFTNTQDFLVSLVSHLGVMTMTEHLELETYTWDVLPPAHRTLDVDFAIARELSWVMNRWAP